MDEKKWESLNHHVTPDWLRNTDPLVSDYLIKYDNMHFLSEYIPKNSRVVDVGCGTGAFLSKLKTERDCIVVGADIVEKVLKTGVNHFGINGVRTDCRELPFRDGHFDVVASFGLFEHFKSYDKLLTEWTRILKPGGIHICEVPNRYGLFGGSALRKKLYEKKHGEWKFGYEYRYSPSELKKIFENEGYKVEKILTSKITPPFCTIGLSRFPQPLKKIIIKLYSRIEDIMMRFPFGYYLILIARK